MGATPSAIDATAAVEVVDGFVGRTIEGRYRVTELLGAGGMGAVYRGEHLAIGKAVAIKVLHPRMSNSAEASARFQREALAGGRIGHPNCVAVSDFGTLDDGAFYLVMELLAGESLGDLLAREGRLPWRRALHIARHVLRGLGHAHEHGVVHRDIKPDNVFLARTEDDPDLAKVLDFGIAKLVGEGGVTITQAGITIGTPAYLSPEQAFGGELDGRSDLYSLSVLLYEMLTGQTPFANRDLMAMLTAHAVAEPPAMREVAPDAGIPAAVEALVRHGLAKTTAERIGTASEYVARIDELLSGRVSTEVHHAQAAPVGLLTPMPFPAATPQPTSTELSSIAPPRSWKKVAIWGAGGILAVGIVAGLASRGGDDAPPATSKPAPARKAAPPPAAAKPTPPPAVKPAVKPAPRPEPKPEVVPPPAPPPVAVTDAIRTPAERYQAAITQLEKGKTCPLRKAAIAQLVELGDARAVKALKKARYRMRGGLLGIGDSNTNSCLKADAEAAMAELSKKKPEADPPSAP